MFAPNKREQTQPAACQRKHLLHINVTYVIVKVRPGCILLFRRHSVASININVEFVNRMDAGANGHLQHFVGGKYEHRSSGCSQLVTLQAQSAGPEGAWCWVRRPYRSSPPSSHWKMPARSMRAAPDGVSSHMASANELSRRPPCRAPASRDSSLLYFQQRMGRTSRARSQKRMVYMMWWLAPGQAARDLAHQQGGSRVAAGRGAGSAPGKRGSARVEEGRRACRSGNPACPAPPTAPAAAARPAACALRGGGACPGPSAQPCPGSTWVRLKIPRGAHWFGGPC